MSAGTFLRLFAFAGVAVCFVSLCFVILNFLQSNCAFIALSFFSPARQQEQPVDENGWLQLQKPPWLIFHFKIFNKKCDAPVYIDDDLQS